MTKKEAYTVLYQLYYLKTGVTVSEPNSYELIKGLEVALKELKKYVCGKCGEKLKRKKERYKHKKHGRICIDCYNGLE